MNTVRAELLIKVMVNCPTCGMAINLLDDKDTSGVAHNDDANVLRQACPDTGEYWHQAHEKFEVDDVQCSYCRATFQVKGLDW